MPSRMSDSLTTSSVGADPAGDPGGDQGAGGDHVGAAGVHRRDGPDLLDRLVDQIGQQAGEGIPGDHGPVHPAPVVLLEPEVDRGQRGHRAGDPDPGPGGRRGRRRSRRAGRPRTSRPGRGRPGPAGRRRGTARSAGPSRRRARSTSRIVPSRSPRINSVEPPPMSITSTGSGPSSTPLTAPANDSRASRSPLITSGTTPSRSRIPAKNSSRFRASRAAEVATKSIVGRHSGVADQLGVRLGGGEGPGQRVGVELAGRVDALAEPDDLGPPVELDQPAVAVGFGDQQPDRVGAAVDGRRPGFAGTHGRRLPPGRSTGPERPDGHASSPSGLTPGPAARAWPARACRHFTRSGIPPALTLGDLGHLAQLRPGRRR